LKSKRKHEDDDEEIEYDQIYSKIASAQKVKTKKQVDYKIKQLETIYKKLQKTVRLERNEFDFMKFELALNHLDDILKKLHILKRNFEK
jgi:hypothetical protein